MRRSLFWRQPMRGRDPEENHRAATPLELFFDLTFVIAVAQATHQLHHGLAERHIWPTLGAYAIVFFAIWWAWMNFTWFASAYDTDDAFYRLLTLVQMGGVLVVATGIPAVFNEFDFSTTIYGYVLMRVAMVIQWLRAAREDPERRKATIRYAIGIVLAQAGWCFFLFIPELHNVIVVLLLVLAEISVPVWAEFSGKPTTWHPGHIAERYGLFTIIVAGEVLLAVMTAVQSSMESSGLSNDLILLAIGGLLLIFGVWWAYFNRSTENVIRVSLHAALRWGYGHYFIFATVAALGAGLLVAVDTLEADSHVSPEFAAFSVAIPLALFLIVYSLSSQSLSSQK